jgi:nucleoside phosphorylase
MIFKIKTKPLPLLLLAATRQECRVVLDQGNQQIIKNKFGLTLFQVSKNILLLKIGVGFKINRKKFSKLLDNLKPALAINFGICGALQDEIKIFDNYLIDKVYQVNAPEIDIRTQIHRRVVNSDKIKQGSLLTVNQPVLNVIKRKELSQKTGCQLVDMEGYKVTQAMVGNSIPLWIIKQVTDSADEGTKDRIRINRPKWQKNLQMGIYNLIQMLDIEENVRTGIFNRQV